MFEIAANYTEVLGMLLFIMWTISGYRIGRLVFRPTLAKLRRSARRNFMQLGLNLLVILGQAVLVAISWGINWHFASNRVMLALPIVLVPTAAVIWLSLPRLWRLWRQTADNAAPVPAETRAHASDPQLVIPVQAAAIGAFWNFWIVFIDRPTPPYTRYLLVLLALLLVGTGVLYLRQYHRQRHLSGPTARASARPSIRLLRTVVGLAIIGLTVFGVIKHGLASSRLPDRLNMTAMANMDWGGGPIGMMHAHTMGTMSGMKSVTGLTGSVDGTPDVKFTLIAQEKQILLSSGQTVEAWTFNGQAPGPELRMHQGDLVEVTLVNHLPKEGVTLHWHGLDVPNAEDGVAGVTQDAVQPGQSFTYRFRPQQAGTFWYHSHQASSEAVRRGLFGSLVVLPKGAPGDGSAGVDTAIMAHTWYLKPSGASRAETLGLSDTLERRVVQSGTPVRLRVVNTSDNFTEDFIPRTFTFSGARFKIAAIDGTDLNQPSDLPDSRLELAEGGRYDLTFTMPNNPVRLTDLLNRSAGLLLSPDGTGDGTVPAQAPLFDPLHYGQPKATALTATTHFDRHFTLTLDDAFRFYDGQFFPRPTINGQVFPNTPMLMVREGDAVKTTFVNRGHLDHPMHLHGHHMLVLSRNGQAASSSPWWTDTLNVKPGEIFEVAFRADNPGLWMDHCHNLDHAALGMVMHLGYEGVTTPFEIGHTTVNRPE